MPTTTTENLEQIYDAQLKNQKSQLTQNYQQALSDIDASKETAAKQLDQNLNTTALESQRAQKNYNEVQNAYGLTSGARAQARLAQDNQLQADLTALRTAHATADAERERNRTLLGQQYSAAIAQAQAENDIAKAQALYAEAKEADQKLTAQQESAAALMAQVGDFSLYKTLYGLTDDQLAKLQPTSESNPTTIPDGSNPTVPPNGTNVPFYDGWNDDAWKNYFAHLIGDASTINDHIQTLVNTDPSLKNVIWKFRRSSNNKGALTNTVKFRDYLN